jgi:hypothetical protein
MINLFDMAEVYNFGGSEKAGMKGPKQAVLGI